MIAQDIESRIRTMSLEEAYNFALGEKEFKGELHNKLRFGITIPLDIYDYLNGNLMIKRKRGLIIYQGRRYDMSEIYTEMEERHKILMEFLIELYGGKTYAGIISRK